VLSWRGINGSSPTAVLSRFENGDYIPSDVERVVELSLLGGGVSERDVEALLDAHVRNQPLGPNMIIAKMVLAALFVGAENAGA
jgi:hypothetical protein